MHSLTHRISATAITVAASVCLLLISAVLTYAKEWRGITPLYSTRDDVERLLGKPTMPPNDSDYYFYDLKDVIAEVWFEADGCGVPDSQRTICGLSWNVPQGTVTSIGVVFKHPRPVSQVVSIAGFKEEATCEGLVYYRSESEGLDVETYKGDVLALTYSPTDADSYLHCPAQPERCRMGDARKFDEYGDIRFEDEKARLDNVAVELQNAPNLRLAVLAYGGRKSRPDDAIKRAERAKKYLVGYRHINPWQVVAASCGYKEELSVELWPVGVGAYRLYGSPTVDPSEVQRPEGTKHGGSGKQLR